jgi:hypothetical protein
MTAGGEILADNKLLKAAAESMAEVKEGGGWGRVAQVQTCIISVGLCMVT